MELTFTRNGSENTEIVGPKVSYGVVSSKMGRHTCISRNGTQVAEVEYHAWKNDLLRMGGQEWRVSDFLMKTGSWWSCHMKRTFSANGAQYTWKYSSSVWTLERDSDRQILASMHQRTLKDSKLQVSDEALPIMDIVIVTLTLVRIIQTRQQQAGAAAAASSSSSSAAAAAS
ncbi:hypothetical protein BKA62DRAFT_711538 [Auriculariales sp. MPI-PUGE-AT-0066]|nr:hypothetical protein BKA62DRAFT_711538 [Auriculariales sp. MPI-PUGE-AT-0066]